MKTAIILIITLVVGLVQFPNLAFSQELLIANFDKVGNQNNIGDEFGTWGPDPDYCIVGIKYNFVKEGLDVKGSSLRIEYDIDTEMEGVEGASYSDVSSPSEEAYNGFWMKMGKIKTAGFNKLVFFIRGDEQYGFTSRVRIEIRNWRNELGRYLITDINEDWKRIVIPFDDKGGITDWSKLAEFNIKFDQTNCDVKKGAILIDDFYLINE